MNNVIVGIFGVSGVTVCACVFLWRRFRLPRFPPDRARDFVERSRERWVVHRGGRPENTLAALRASKARGATAVELDVGVTRDGCPVLLHDAAVDRTSDGTGLLSEMSLEKAKELDFGIKFGSEFKAERIPTLNEVLDLCEELGLCVYLEVKLGQWQVLLPALKQLYANRKGLYSWMAVISFWPTFLYKLHKADDRILTGLILTQRGLVLWPDGLTQNKTWWKHILSPVFDRTYFWLIEKVLWNFLGLSLLVPNKSLIYENRFDLQLWKKREVMLLSWTADSLAEKEHFEQVVCVPVISSHLVLEDSPQQDQSS